MVFLRGKMVARGGCLGGGGGVGQGGRRREEGRRGKVGGGEKKGHKNCCFSPLTAQRAVLLFFNEIHS